MLLKHLSILLSYTGIWFISGAVSHGFFSGTRSLIMAGLGIILFLIGYLMERKLDNNNESISMSQYLWIWVIAILFSLGIGMFNGWLQHFLDSPLRSLRIIPVGYMLSLVITPWKYDIKNPNWSRTIFVWCLVSIFLAILGYAAYTRLPRDIYMQSDHQDSDNHNESKDSHTDEDNHDKVTNKTRTDFSNDEKMNIHLCLMGGWENCEDIMNPWNRNSYADAIKEQCELMPGMQACDDYFGVVSPPTLSGEQYDTTANSWYQALQTTEIKTLKNGDRLEISLDNINNSIWWKEIRMMGYNGSVPWPMIKVTQGDEITLKVTNNIADIETTVHHHGVRLDTRYDGVPKSMGGFDVPIKKGESLEYKIRFPDAWLFWYHPHVREDFQQELGLYGNFLVVPQDTGYRNPVDQEELLMLDDIQMETGGISPFYKDFTYQSIMGRFGNHFLINGKENFRIKVKVGQVTRLYVTNSANVRPFNIDIAWLPMKLVGWDVGAYEKATIIDNLLIAPAERYIVEIAPSKAWIYDITFKNPAFTKTIGTIEVLENNEQSPAFKSFTLITWNLATISDIDNYRQYFDKEIDKTLRIDMTLNGKTSKDLSLKMPHPHGTGTAKMGWLLYDLSNIERQDEMFEMNVWSTDKNTVWKLIDEETKNENMDIDRSFKQGDIVKVRIINDGNGLHPMQHPIHFHGQRFLILNKNGVKNNNLVWKDTVLTLPGEYTDILIDMSNPWWWMAHCHISEHMHAGMMMSFEVGDTVKKNVGEMKGH